MIYDNCASCEEKNTTIEFLDTQLQDIREIVESGKIAGIKPKIVTALDRIEDVLER